jgi:hypothetical protein
MQKVESSNLFSRFLPCKSTISSIALRSLFVFLWALESLNQERVFASFGHWCPE